MNKHKFKEGDSVRVLRTSQSHQWDEEAQKLIGTVSTISIQAGGSTRSGRGRYYIEGNSYPWYDDELELVTEESPSDDIVYTHQTQENPPRLAREIKPFKGDPNYPRLFMLLNKDEIESPTRYTKELNYYYFKRDDSMNLVPIKKEPQKVYWNKFEHIKLDAWYREKQFKIGKKIEKIDAESSTFPMALNGAWHSFADLKELEWSLDGLTWHECVVSE